MTEYFGSVGVKVPELLLPNREVDMSRWAVVACDQFTSQPDYWEETERTVGDAPSALRMMLPECYLGRPGEEERIASVNAHMRRYMETGVLENRGEGFVYVLRTANGKTRAGLIAALDLEEYDCAKGSSGLIRASEGTILERIPPRLRIRKDAPLEMPHILVLIDDPGRTVIEPAGKGLKGAEKLYGFDLMQGGGHIEGYLINGEERVNGVLKALAALIDRDAYAKKYGTSQPPMLFAMGDGNHSFAAAKAGWERIKAERGLDGKSEHPARYCMVELENIHDEGIVFEPIHRVMFGAGAGATERIREALAERNGSCVVMRSADMEGLRKAMEGEPGHVLPFVNRDGPGCFYVERPVAQLEVGTLQNALDAVIKEFPGACIDYIHGARVVMELGAKEGNTGFLLPAMDKNAFFRTVIFDGALPRKTFSMGEANEKRYYLECRKITE